MPTIVSKADVQRSPAEGRRGPADTHGAPGRDADHGRKSTVFVAAFTSPLTDRLGREAGFPLAVIDAVADPGRHAARLSATWHAAWTVRLEWFCPFDYHYDDRRSCTYAQMPLDPRWMGRHDPSPGVRVARGCLTVDVPAGSLADFAQTFRLALADRTFERVASSTGRVTKRFATGRGFNITPRCACDPALMTVAGQFARVSDLFAFRPRDRPRIADAALQPATPCL